MTQNSTKTTPTAAQRWPLWEVPPGPAPEWRVPVQYLRPYGWVPAPRNDYGVIAVVLALLGLLAAVSFVFSFAGLVLGALAVVFGGIGLRLAARREATNRAQAGWGLGLGIVSIALSALMTFALFGDPDALAEHEAVHADQVALGQQVTYDNGLVVTAKDWRQSGRLVEVTVVVDNATGDDVDLEVADITAQADHVDGVGDTDWDYLKSANATGPALPKTVAAGDTVSGTYAFELPDDVTELQIEAIPSWGYGYAGWSKTL